MLTWCFVLRILRFPSLEAFGNLAVSPVSRNLTVMHFSLCSCTPGLVLGSPFSVETILSWNISYFFFFQFYWDSVNMLLFSRSVVSDSVGSHGLEPTRLLHPWDFSGKSTGVGCHFLLQGLFLTQWIKLVSPALAGRFFYHWATWKAPGWHTALYKFKVYSIMTSLHTS